MRFKSTFGEIHYDIIGTGSPLLLIHGTPFSSRAWSKIKDALKYKHKIYTYDLLGYGLSEKVEDVSLAIQNKVLCELLDFWELNSPDVVAHDFGGTTLLRSIILNSRHYNKIMLIDIVALAPWGSPFVQHVRKHESVFNEIPDYIHKAMVQAYIKDAIYSKVTDSDIDMLVQPWLSNSGKKAFYRQIAQMDQKYTDEIESGLFQIENEIRILWGEEDNWIPLKIGKQLHEKLPKSSFRIIPGSNHLMQIDKPNEIIKEIEEFFQA